MTATTQCSQASEAPNSGYGSNISGRDENLATRPTMQAPNPTKPAMTAALRAALTALTCLRSCIFRLVAAPGLEVQAAQLAAVDADSVVDLELARPDDRNDSRRHVRVRLRRVPDDDGAGRFLDARIRRP